MSHIASTTQTARKDHQCDLCYRTIQPKSVYHRHVASYFGRMVTCKFHDRCDELAELWIDTFDYDGEGVQFGSHDQVIDDLTDHFGCAEKDLPTRGKK